MKTAKMLALLWVGLIACLPPASGSPTPLSSQEIFQKWAGAVVTVETATKTGTGFFDKLGYLYTAYHVLDGASTAAITFSDGRKARITSAVAADKVKDYAILQADSSSSGPPLGDYTGLQPGERVTVIGSPRGLAQTVTEGIVSAKRQDGDRQLLQLSAGISPGSSGSPVFNTQGEVVGLVVETLEGGQTLNFAVSSADLKCSCGIPLAQAFGAPATAGGSGSVLCHAQDPRCSDLWAHGALGYVGLKNVTVLVGDVPEAMVVDLNAEDLRQWVTNTLSNGGIKVMTAEEQKAAAGAAPASPSDVDFLRWCDGESAAVGVSLTAVRSQDGSVSLSYLLDVRRAGIIMPGWMDRPAVDVVSGVQCLGAARNLKEDIRQTITQAAAQIVSRYQYANRPSDTSATSAGH